MARSLRVHSLTRPIGKATAVFTAAETAACRRLLELALQEDLNDIGDLTSQAVIPEDLQGQAAFVARVHGVCAGLPAAALVFAAVDPRVVLQPAVQDGAPVSPGAVLAVVRGPMRAILTGERTALNFMQHLSGVASRTRTFVAAVAGLPCRILDTRKTAPGWRVLQKYAIRCGGGHNHRMGLYDGILIKDNHLAALAGAPQAITRAVQAARQRAGAGVTVEIEIDGLHQLDEALACRPDIVLLDNMRPDELRAAVTRRNAVAPGVQLEASGGVNLSTVRALAESGVERISVGELTHSAPALDIALDYQ
jgi:nicotinate-nucleotide pyrophosphorylase (carboxylating)